MSAPRGSGRLRRAISFAPGHVTGFFGPELRAHDPRARGSTGAGVVLAPGVRAEASVTPSPRSRLEVTADVGGPLPISEDVARRLTPAGAGLVRVHLTHQLPVGQGFGMSAAGALSTGLAVAKLFRISRQHATEVAHLAELFGRGGLGGVPAIGGGGLEFRVRPGVPPYGRVVHRRFAPSLFVGIVGGPLPSPSVLSDPRALRRIERALGESWTERRAPRVHEFLDASEQFTDRAGLAPPPLARTLRAIRSEGAWAAQAMFGRSFFAVPRSAAARRRVVRALERRAIRAVVTPASRVGARLLGTRG